MGPDESTTAVISRSFLALQRLRATFDLPGDERLCDDKALRLAAALGATALPLCERHFAAEDEPDAGDGGDGEGRASWAHVLLFHLARDPELRDRIVADLDLLAHRAASDRTRLRAIALLAELGAELPDDTALADPEGARRRSSRDLALCLGTPADVARAGEHLVEQLDEGALVDLFDDLIDSDPGSALILLDELLVRDELDDTCRHELRQRRAAARQLAPEAAPMRARRPGDAISCRAANHADGRRILLVSERQAGSRPPRRRVMCLLVAQGGVLVDGHYAEDQSAASIETELVAPLAREGFDFGPVARPTARGFLIEAARLAVRAGRALPRPFYLGRHLLGVRDEHLDGTARCPAAVDLAALLERAIVLVRSEPARALPLLDRYVAQVPEDAEGHAQLGLCRLGLGDAATALDHLERATSLDPDEPLHHWNKAAAAHRAGLRGACYLALEGYRKATRAAGDVAPGADSRRAIAETFAEEYARLAVLEHPGATPRRVASAEERRRRRPPRSKRQRG
jgi:tetratricopeptide (TPR) repeat protein